MIAKWFRVVLLVAPLSLFACSSRPQLPQIPKPKPKPVPTQPSNIKVEVRSGGPAVVTTSAAEFQIRADGYVQAFLLLKDGRKLSLDEPRVGALADSDYAIIDGKEVHFAPDFDKAQALESFGKMGAGKRLEIPAHPIGPSGEEFQRTLVVEAYDRYPRVLFVSVDYKNTGSRGIRIDKVIDQRHRLSAKLANGKTQSWEMWSYHGTGRGVGTGEVVRLKRTFARPNALESIKKTEERDFAVVAFWTDEVGEAIGQMDTLSEAAAIPVKVDPDGRVSAQLETVAGTMLAPGENYSGPHHFLCVYGGDDAEPLHLWEAVPQFERAKASQPSSPAKP